MRILVLGGYGFIGSHICQRLKAEGHTIGIVDCFHQYYTFPDWEYYPVLVQRKQITNTDGTIVEISLELEGEQGQSCKFLDITTKLKGEPRRWIHDEGYNKQDHISVDGHALSELPNFPLIDSKLNSCSKYGVVTSELVCYSHRNETKNAFITQALDMPYTVICAQISGEEAAIAILIALLYEILFSICLATLDATRKASNSGLLIS